jgi:nitrogen regulatory protein PII
MYRPSGGQCSHARIIKIIDSMVNSSRDGDGKIFVLALEAAQRVRTGETGASAL